jgi:hypothetical protein
VLILQPFPRIHDLTLNDTVEPQATLTAELYRAGLTIGLSKEQIIKVLCYKFILELVAVSVYGLEGRSVPGR